jgi:AcrR family transcriptional regulator
MSVAAAKNPKTDARWAKTREKLLAGGRQVFAEQGVEATSVLDIIRAAGVSQPSFYNHFDSKDALAREIAADFFRRDRRAKQVVFASIDDPALAIAINLLQTLSIATDDPVIAWTLVKSETLRDLIISSETDPLVAMLQAGVKKQRFVLSSARTTAIAIRGAALALVQDILNGNSEKHAVRDFQELVLCMLGLSMEDAQQVTKHAQQFIKQQQTRLR